MWNLFSWLKVLDFFFHIWTVFFFGKRRKFNWLSIESFSFLYCSFLDFDFFEFNLGSFEYGKSGKMDRKSLNFSIEIVWVFYCEVLWIFLLLICWFMKDVVEERLMENSENFKLNLRNIENIWHFPLIWFWVEIATYHRNRRHLWEPFFSILKTREKKFPNFFNFFQIRISSKLLNFNYPITLSPFNLFNNLHTKKLNKSMEPNKRHLKI